MKSKDEHNLAWIPEFDCTYRVLLDEVCLDYLSPSWFFSEICQIQALRPRSYLILSSLLHKSPSQAGDMQKQQSWEHTLMNQKCLCVTGS